MKDPIDKLAFAIVAKGTHVPLSWDRVAVMVRAVCLPRKKPKNPMTALEVYEQSKDPRIFPGAEPYWRKPKRKIKARVKVKVRRKHNGK